MAEYATLNESDKLLIARDALRGKESDHYRLSILDTDNPEVAQRLSDLEVEVARLRKVVSEQEKAAKKESNDA